MSRGRNGASGARKGHPVTQGQEIAVGFRHRLPAKAVFLSTSFISAHTYFVLRVGPCRRRARSLPLEGRCDSLSSIVEKALGECVEGGEIIGGEDFSLDDREVDFDLVEPAGMNPWTRTKRITSAGGLNGGMRRAVSTIQNSVIGGAGQRGRGPCRYGAHNDQRRGPDAHPRHIGCIHVRPSLASRAEWTVACRRRRACIDRPRRNSSSAFASQMRW